MAALGASRQAPAAEAPDALAARVVAFAAQGAARRGRGAPSRAVEAAALGASRQAHTVKVADARAARVVAFAAQGAARRGRGAPS